jgi:flavin reductase (DIM6/NTAB) family NADH-FMN oxidoreductase RutF
MHRVIQPKIMYFGTPVILISTLNEDGSANLAPMSSAWWLGHSCMLGLGRQSKTTENLLREKQCVLNMPSSDMVSAVDKLALTTGKIPMPEYKIRKGFRFVKNKFEIAKLTPVASDLVKPPKVLECPVQLEAMVKKFHQFGPDNDYDYAFEVQILRMHIKENLLNDEKRHYIETDKWKPLIMSFCEFYELGNKVYPSRLAKVF